MSGPRGADDRAYARAPAVLWRSTARTTLAVTLDGREALTLAGAGSRAWELLDRPRTLAELAATLAAVYSVPQGVVAADLAPVLDELVGHGVVTVSAR